MSGGAITMPIAVTARRIAPALSGAWARAYACCGSRLGPRLRARAMHSRSGRTINHNDWRMDLSPPACTASAFAPRRSMQVPRSRGGCEGLDGGVLFTSLQGQAFLTHPCNGLLGLSSPRESYGLYVST